MTTAKEVLEVYGKARDATADADGNTASEDRAVDALKLLAGMDIPLKVFSDGSLGDCPKAIRKMAKKGATDGIRAAADSHGGQGSGLGRRLGSLGLSSLEMEGDGNCQVR